MLFLLISFNTSHMSTQTKLENSPAKWDILTKNERFDCDASPTCHKLNFPSPSATPNLFPCCENRHLVTVKCKLFIKRVSNAWNMYWILNCSYFFCSCSFDSVFTFCKCSWWTRRAHRLLMTPFPHLYRAILTARQIQRHQGMRTHALYVVHFVFQHLGDETDWIHQ